MKLPFTADGLTSPAVILLDGNGVERYRTEGRLPRKQAIVAALAAGQ